MRNRSRAYLAVFLVVLCAGCGRKEIGGIKLKLDDTRQELERTRRELAASRQESSSALLRRCRAAAVDRPGLLR